jgi:PAS domain S-box-containing protein
MKKGIGKMRLRAKLIILCASLSISITAILGGILYGWLWEDNLKSIEQNISKQLQDVAFSLSSFFDEAESDVNAIVANELVRTRDDRNFTSFLDADERTFQYRYQEIEKKIIDVFSTYRATHRYVNSVYMGRENGSFVRSHKRERPTRYDPRERPWYITGKANPSKVIETEAYPSLTTNDVNIGIVKALVDDAGSCFGVVGVDVTLVNLTDYILNLSISPSGKLILIDRNGIVLASREKGMRSTDIERYSPELKGVLSKTDEGVAALSFMGEKHFAFFRPPTRQGWRITVLIPSTEIGARIRAPVLMTISGLAIGWFLLGTLVLIGLNVVVIRPLKRFTEETSHVARTSNLDRRIEIHSHDEIGVLAGSYNQMIDSLRLTQESLEKKESDLREYGDHLEELVEQRTADLQDTNRLLKKEIAERIMVQQALIEREAQYQDLVESANSIILRWLPDGRVTFFNGFAQSFFGYSEKEIIGQNIVGTIVAIGDSNGIDLSSLIGDIVAHPEAHVRSVNQNIKKSGERAWVAWSNKPIFAQNGQISEMLSIGIDITQLVRTERELRQTLEELASAKERSEAADRLKSAFLATMSHELRTPLNSIIGFTGILLQGMVGPLNEEQKKQLDMVRNSAQHLLSLISDVLDISKIEAGQMGVAYEPVDLRASIQKVVQIVRPLAEKKSLELVVSVAPDVGTIASDTRRLEQILLNILGNAVKFTEQGRILATCATGPGGVVFHVTDTGIGISDADIEKIFKPFMQVDTGLARRYEGTGLGLPICKRLVELLGGRIWVESAKDKGSTFSFSLPAERSLS